MTEVSREYWSDKDLDERQTLRERTVEGRFLLMASSAPSCTMLSMFILLLVPALLATASAECQNGRIIASGHLTCEQKQLIVDLHNELREKVASGKVPTQPSAADMVEVRWSDPIAEKAQNWADGCVFVHDPNLTIGGAHIGQNLAQEWSNKDVLRNADLTGMINSWFNEVYKFGYNGTFSYDSGHYSQVIWGDTKYVGCGLTYYLKQDSYYSYLVCDYLPPGNWIGQKPYVYGPQDCGTHKLVKSKTYPTLCAIDDRTVKACPSKLR